MCGIFVSVGFTPDSKHIDVVAHRGPDGRGWRVFNSEAGPVALGHRRLSIIDLDPRADQPINSQSERYWLVFNGEIYNFIELREELESEGVTFKTASDSEVLLEAYAFWGEAMLERLRGMFAFVIFDVREHLIFAARDRFGIKPLYYFVSKAGVAFGSEIKQLLELEGFSRRINLARTRDYLTVGFTDHTEETMFADARQLRGGQCVTLDLKRGYVPLQLPVRRYYDLPRSRLPRMNEKEATERFLMLFEDAVRLHLRADVRTGSSLSGGLDSSAIVVMMNALLGRAGSKEPLHTVGACYEDKSVDERPFMEAIVALTNGVPHYIYPSAAHAMEISEKLTWHQDEPHYNTSMYAQWSVFAEAKRHSIKVLLDGQGADEHLAGYHYDSFPTHARTLMQRGDLFALGKMFIERRRWHGIDFLQQFLAIPNRPKAPQWIRTRRAKRLAAPGEGWLDSPLLRPFLNEPGTYDATLSRDGMDDVRGIGDLCIANMMSLSLPKLLRYEDRNSMAHSIEARLPFLDHKLVEFTIGLWDQHKVVGGDTKRVLRAAMAGHLPEAVRLRRDKVGFSTPQQNWFRGPLRSQIERGVGATLDLFPGLFHNDEVISYVEAAMDGRRPADERLWMLVILGIWGRVFGTKT